MCHTQYNPYFIFSDSFWLSRQTGVSGRHYIYSPLCPPSEERSFDVSYIYLRCMYLAKFVFCLTDMSKSRNIKKTDMSEKNVFYSWIA